MIKFFKRKPNHRAKIAVLEGLYREIKLRRDMAAGKHQRVSRYDDRLKELRHEILALQLEAERG